MAAAFALTDEENWQKKFEITVYQLGWRLGGKGASGRNLNSKMRIEEHGLPGRRHCQHRLSTLHIDDINIQVSRSRHGTREKHQHGYESHDE